MALTLLAPIDPSPSALAIYERMCTAIAECSRVDEAKDIRDKALALEAYYRQARNLDAEREAANVRLRAERRVGELLKELARAEPRERAERANATLGRSSPDATNVTSPYAAALDQHGMSRQTASRFQALANIPAATFETALRAPEKPSAAALLKHNAARAEVRNPTSTRTPVVSDDALLLWGHLRDFERHGMLNANWSAPWRSMTDAMRADVLRLAPQVIAFLSNLEVVNEPA